MSEASEDRKELNSKLSTSTFTWTMGILIVVAMATIGFQNTRISTLEEKVMDNQLIVVKIDTQLAGIQVQLTAMNTNLEKHMEAK